MSYKATFEGHEVEIHPAVEGGYPHGFIDGVDQGRVPNNTGAAVARMWDRITTGTIKPAKPSTR